MVNFFGGVDYVYQQYDCVDQYYYVLYCVVEYVGVKVVIGGIQCDVDFEDQQVGIVRNIGSCFQQVGVVDKLDGYGVDKGYQQIQVGQLDQQVILIVSKQYVIEGDSIIVMCKDGEFFFQYVQ